jgi:hypothetical protein
MSLLSLLKLAFPKEFIREIIRLLPNQPLSRRVQWDLFSRPDYAYAVYNASLQAAALGITRISAIEFGVAGGNGLVALEGIAEEIAAATGVQVDTYGFDSGHGMPAPVDYRDLPYIWQQGFFQMDVDALRKRLRKSTLVLGEFTGTVPSFIANYQPAPIGFISFDADYYSSTVTTFGLLEADHAFFLPRVLCYFDDMIGGDLELHSRYTGELLAIEEFNAAHRWMKIAKIHGLMHKRPVTAWWNDELFAHHRFDHPLYNRHVHPEKDWQMKLR